MYRKIFFFKLYKITELGVHRTPNPIKRRLSLLIFILFVKQVGKKYEKQQERYFFRIYNIFFRYHCIVKSNNTQKII